MGCRGPHGLDSRAPVWPGCLLPRRAPRGGRAQAVSTRAHHPARPLLTAEDWTVSPHGPCRTGDIQEN